MWLLGLIVGMVVGAVGGGGGVVIGALVGGFAGWMFSEARKNANQRHARLETIVSQLSDRVRALEESFAQANKPAVSGSEYQERRIAGTNLRQSDIYCWFHVRTGSTRRFHPVRSTKRLQRVNSTL